MPQSWVPRQFPQWQVLNIRGHAVQVLRNPTTGILENIRLVDNQQPIPKFNPKAYMAYVVDKKDGLEFIVHLNSEGKWISVSPMNDKYREVFGHPPTDLEVSQITIKNMPTRHLRLPRN